MASFSILPHPKLLQGSSRRRGQSLLPVPDDQHLARPLAYQLSNSTALLELCFGFRNSPREPLYQIPWGPIRAIRVPMGQSSAVGVDHREIGGIGPSFDGISNPLSLIRQSDPGMRCETRANGRSCSGRDPVALIERNLTPRRCSTDQAGFNSINISWLIELLSRISFQRVGCDVLRFLRAKVETSLESRSENHGG